MHLSHASQIGRGRSTQLWKGIDRERIAYDPSYGYGQYNDFTEPLYNLAAGTTSTVGSIVTTQKTDGTFTFPTTTRFGIMLLTSSGTNSRGIQMQWPGIFTPTADASILFETRISLSGNGTPGDIFLGLSIIDTTILDNTIASGSEMAGFYAMASNTITAGHRTAGATATTVSTGSATFPDYSTTLTEADTFVKLGFHLQGTRRIEYYVDDVYTGGSTANLPVGPLAVSFALDSNGTTTPLCAIDWFDCVCIYGMRPTVA